MSTGQQGLPTDVEPTRSSKVNGQRRRSWTQQLSWPTGCSKRLLPALSHAFDAYLREPLSAYLEYSRVDAHATLAAVSG